MGALPLPVDALGPVARFDDEASRRIVALPLRRSPWAGRRWSATGCG
ncbi:hypothetical protein [Streptomyces cellulosae]|uniref:Uncharacterized protein n=1 Tax=Streptomyces cellulosae TaxID=1968 RepID=A0ABW7YGI3_STRCE